MKKLKRVEHLPLTGNYGKGVLKLLPLKPKPQPECKLNPFLATKTNRNPLPILPETYEGPVPKQPFKIAIREHLRNKGTFADASTESISSQSRQSILNSPTQYSTENASNQSQSIDMSLKIDISTAIPSTRSSEEETLATLTSSTTTNTITSTTIPFIHPIEHQGSGPYYNFLLTPSEIDFLLRQVPTVVPSVETDLNGLIPSPEARAEMLRRILSLENADQKALTKFNKRRMIEMFGKKPNDTGSSEVQSE